MEFVYHGLSFAVETLIEPMEQFVSNYALPRRFGVRLVTSFVAILLVSAPLKPPTRFAESKKTRRVLIVNDLGNTASPGFAEIDQALWTSLQKSQYRIELY